jgi:hypothetical protein
MIAASADVFSWWATQRAGLVPPSCNTGGVVIDPRTLAFPNASGPEATELNQLLSRYTELAAKVNERSERTRRSRLDGARFSRTQRLSDLLGAP